VRGGKQWEETALVVCFDEHGGTFDPIVPPSCPPPEEGMVGQCGFKFDRLGVRLPAIVISAWTARETIVKDVHSNTSLTRTLREALGLGEAFTNRDAWSDTLAKAFNLNQPRKDEPMMPTKLEWHQGMTLHAQQVREGDCPETSIAVERWKEKLSLESISELGEIILERAMMHLKTDSAQFAHHVTDARKWLEDSFHDNRGAFNF
jgi:phospholipase C